MARVPDQNDVREAYVRMRTGELMSPDSRQEDVEAIAEEEFDDFLQEYREEVLKEFSLDGRGNVLRD